MKRGRSKSPAYKKKKAVIHRVPRTHKIMHKSTVTPILEMITLPSKDTNVRIRTDFATEETALAEPFFKISLNPTPAFGNTFPNDPTSIFPQNLFFMMLDRNPYQAIKIWIPQTNPFPTAKPIPGAGNNFDGFADNTASWIYNVVMYKGSNGSNFFTRFLPLQGSAREDVKFTGMAADPSSNNIPYDAFQWAMEFKSHRYLYIDSGLTSDATHSFATVVRLGLTSGIPANGNMTFNIYAFRNGADTLVLTGKLTPGMDHITLPINQGQSTTSASVPEFHDYYRFEILYDGLLADLVNIQYAINIYGRCSAMNIYPLPGFIARNNQVEAIKVTGASLLLSNDQADQFKNGRIYMQDAESNRSWTGFLQSFNIQVTSLAQLISTMESDPDAKSYPAERGAYNFLKPKHSKDLDWRFTWTEGPPLTEESGTFHVDEYWRYEDNTDYNVITAFINPTAGAGLTTPPLLHLTYHFTVEYRTEDVWTHTAYSTYGPADVNKALEELRLIPQFYENPTHISQLAKKIGVAGLIGGAAIGAASAPTGVGAAVGAGIAGAGGALLAAGEIAELFED